MPEKDKVTNKIRHITLTHIKNGNMATMTQEYFEDFGFGHWKFVVFDNKKNVIHVCESTNSPPEKINQKDIKVYYDRFYIGWIKKENRIKKEGFEREEK